VRSVYFVPEIENAILSGHHMVFLGERGQAKTRIIRGLTRLLDPFIPVVDGCAINDSPLTPICSECRRRRAELGDALPVAWMDRDARYAEKLATPDITIADLIGEVDPIKVAEGRYLSGGQTLIPTMKQRLAAPTDLVDLARLAELRGISVTGTSVSIGAAMTHAEVAASAEIAKAVAPLVARDWPPLEDVQLVMFTEDGAQIVRDCLERQCEGRHEGR